MELFLTILCRAISITLGVVLDLMLLRAILPLFMDVEDTAFGTFLAAGTEPFIIPVRYLMYRFNILQDSPIDWSFTVTCFILTAVRIFLPVV